MRKILIGFAVLLIIVVGALAALPFLIPASTYRNVIETRLEAALGRDVSFAEDPKITFFPQIGARFEGVQISNAEGFEAPYFAKADNMAVSVKWMPLISKRIEIASANFRGTEVFLEEDSGGNSNWVFTPTNASVSETQPTETGRKKPNFDALIPKASLSDSRVNFTSAASNISYDVTDINITASLSGLDDAVGLKGRFAVNGEPISVDGELTSLNQVLNNEMFSVRADIGSDMADTAYEGTLKLGKIISLNGEFSGEIKNASRLVKFANIQLEQDLSKIDSFIAKGKVSGTTENLSLSDLNADVKSSFMSAGFSGDFTLAKDIALNGTFDAEIKDVAALTDFAGIVTEQDLSAFGNINASGAVAGTPNALSFTNIKADQTAKNLNSSFSGNVTIGKNLRANGRLTLKSDDVKALAEALKLDLKGDKTAYRKLNASLTLTTENNSTRTDIETFKFDDMSATGYGLINMSGALPYIEANLDIPSLNLGPYMPETESSNKTGAPTDGWSSEPIDLSILKGINGNVDLSIGRVANQRAEILDVEFNGKLRDGSLSGTIYSKAPEAGRSGQSSLLNPLYSGDLETNFVISSQADKSNRLSFSAEGSGIAAADLIKFFTGQDVLRGVASLNTAAKTNGNSIADFVQNLSGSFKADVTDGALFNINLAQLFRTASELSSSGNFSLSPEQETDFSSLKLQGDIESGTANLELFRLLSPILQADATGTIDLFNQSLDVRIVPRATAASGQKLAGVDIGQIGIPVRIKNRWQSPSVSLDTEYYSTLIANEAQNRLESELKDRLGGRLGVDEEDPISGILDGVLRDKSTTKNTETSEDAENSKVTNDDKKKEEEPEDVAKDILKGLIFGDKK